MWWTLFRLTALGLAIAVGFMRPARSAGEEPKEFYCDFRHPPLPAELKLFNAEEGRFFQSEAQGLRITLPKTWIHPWGGVGFQTAFSFGGDFEVTTTYEILHAQTPPSGFGVGLVMAVGQPGAGGTTVNGASLNRLVRANGKPILLWNHAVANGWPEKSTDGPETAGRLRLKRTGTTLFYLWSPERDGGEFQTIAQIDFEAGDINGVRLAATTGRQPCEVSVRLIDLRIRSQMLGSSTATAGAQGNSGTMPENRGMVWWAILGGIALFLCMCLAIGLAVRQSRRSRNLAESASPSAEPDQAAALPGPLSITCAACGKQLKAKGELAGKKVKCTQCGQPVPVPQTNGNEAGRTSV